MSKVCCIPSGHRARLWARRDVLVESNLDLARSIGRTLAQSLPASFDIDDLIATGYLGLIKAATNYRPRAHNGTPFSAYARPVIRGAILDSVRRGRWVENTRPSVDDAAEPGAVPAYEVAIDQGRASDRVAAAVAQLPERLQLLVHMHYGDEQRLPAVADVLDIGKSRASQLHVEALRLLRLQLAAGF